MGEEFVSGENKVGLFSGCETFGGVSGAIDGREFELRVDILDSMLSEGRDHLLSFSGESAARTAILGCSAGVSANVGEEFACSEFGNCEVGSFFGCETF